MPLMTSGVYIGSDDRGYEAETSYYLNFQIISALASLAKIDSFNDSYGWENPCQYYHYYTDHLLFSIGQITNRFQVNNRDSEKEKERKTLNRGNYQFSEDRFPLLSDKKARNVVEHIDEYNLNIIESNRGVGGFNLIDASTESTLVQTLRTNRHTHPYTLDLLSHELFIRRNDENLTISFEKLKSELLTLRKSVKSFMEISSFLNGYNVRILATVRNYALQKVKADIAGIVHYSEVTLDSLSDDEIKSLVKDYLGIINRDYLNRIATIAEGNARIALIAGKVAVDANGLQSISDVTGLYEEYYGKAFKEANLDGDLQLQITAGVIAFLGSIHLDHIEPVLNLLVGYNIDISVFKSCAPVMKTFIFVPDNIKHKSDAWIKHYISKYNTDYEKMESLFSVLSELCDDRKKDYISYLMTVNADPELFRRIPLCPTSYSWSGSAVPLYSKWADYLKGLLPLFSGIQFLQHQKVVNDEIEHLSKMIERAEIEDLLQG